MKVNKLTLLIGKRHSGQVEWYYERIKEMFFMNSINNNYIDIFAYEEYIIVENEIFFKKLPIKNVSHLKYYLANFQKKQNEVIIDMSIFRDVTIDNIKKLISQFNCPINLIKFDISEEDYKFNIKYTNMQNTDKRNINIDELKNINKNVNILNINLVKKDPYYLFLEKYKLYKWNPKKFGTLYENPTYNNLFGVRKNIIGKKNDTNENYLIIKNRIIKYYEIDKYNLQKEVLDIIQVGVAINKEYYYFNTEDLYNLIKNKFIEEEYREG